MDKKRLTIYLAITFITTWTYFLIIFLVTGKGWEGLDSELQSLVGLGMLFPAISHVLTRFITREGYAVTGKDSMMLGINFRDKKWIYYVFALIVPWIIFEVGVALALVVFPRTYDPLFYKEVIDDKRVIYLIPLAAMINGPIYSFAAFGEEFGWRGYMMPKLMKLMSEKKAVLVGGIIWGLWHAPLTVTGHNFGTDYPGYPYLGVVMMCLFCIFVGIMLTYITIKSESIWPTTIMHAVLNNNPSMLKVFCDTEKMSSILDLWNMITIPEVIIGFICLYLLTKKKA